MLILLIFFSFALFQCIKLWLQTLEWGWQLCSIGRYCCPGRCPKECERRRYRRRRRPRWRSTASTTSSSVRRAAARRGCWWGPPNRRSRPAPRGEPKPPMRAPARSAAGIGPFLRSKMWFLRKRVGEKFVRIRNQVAVFRKRSCSEILVPLHLLRNYYCSKTP